MDRKAQAGFGFIIMAAVAILIGLAFWTGTFSENIGTLTQTRESGNVTFTLPANGESTQLTFCEQAVESIIVTNATSGATVPSTNYTISQSTGSDGYLAAFITTTTSAYAGGSVNGSCEYQPYGYIDNGGSRAITSLIAVFMAILIMVAALPDARNFVVDWIRGK